MLLSDTATSANYVQLQILGWTDHAENGAVSVAWGHAQL